MGWFEDNEEPRQQRRLDAFVAAASDGPSEAWIAKQRGKPEDDFTPWGQVVIEPDLMTRLERVLAATEHVVPLSVESAVNMALEAFLDGAGA
jgi:hypothetical protein